ncbi:hypothetical protein [Pyrolobus fumarii]|uniref:hypothetical protein n=1 Tax=Pyrolobus fumarii TaxID=54252 RepID=UPI00064FB3CB|nr:hypothetical protein [Pyrolobus fumarii]
MNVACDVLTPYPRSDRVRRLLRRLEELGEASTLETMRALVEDSLMLMGAQLAVGTRSVADPLLDWHDLLRPFAEAWRGVWVDGLARWFDNNFFYRVPVIEDLPDPQRLVTPGRAAAMRSVLPSWAAIRIVLPGPVTFTRLAKIREGLDPIKVAERVAEILALEAEKSVKNGASVIEVHEPFLGDMDARPEDAEEAARLANKIFARIKDKAETRLVTYYAPPRREVWKKLSDVNADYVIIDYVDKPEAAREALDAWTPSGLGLGLINARSIYPEDVDATAGKAKELAMKYKVEKLLVTTSAPLDLIPLRYALEKTRITCEVVRRID